MILICRCRLFQNFLIADGRHGNSISGICFYNAKGRGLLSTPDRLNNLRTLAYRKKIAFYLYFFNPFWVKVGIR